MWLQNATSLLLPTQYSWQQAMCSRKAHIFMFRYHRRACTMLRVMDCCRLLVGQSKALLPSRPDFDT